MRGACRFQAIQRVVDGTTVCRQQGPVKAFASVDVFGNKRCNPPRHRRAVVGILASMTSRIAGSIPDFLHQAAEASIPDRPAKDFARFRI